MEQKPFVAAIIAEYNPFHNGHAYQIAQTRRAGATHILALMSGNFTQRGDPACAPKQIRARAAVAGGADLVIELPLPYAMATAERFAFGSVALLQAAGCVNLLSFGSECADPRLLQKAAETADSPACGALIKSILAGGCTFARARREAVRRLSGEETAACLDRPNDILAVEYLRQLTRLHSEIRPFAVKRIGAGHDGLAPEGNLASASFLRTLTDINSWAPFLPDGGLEIYRDAALAGLFPHDSRRLYLPALALLRRMRDPDFARLPDLSEGLENRLARAVREASGLEDLISAVKTKRYPLSRVRRLIWSACLEVDGALCKTPPPYLRVLAMNRRGAQLLGLIKRTASLPVSASLRELQAAGPAAQAFARLEGRAADFYVLGLPAVQPCGSDYTARMSIQPDAPE